jgi:hypothetical protein
MRLGHRAVLKNVEEAILRFDFIFMFATMSLGGYGV